MLRDQTWVSTTFLIRRKTRVLRKPGMAAEQSLRKRDRLVTLANICRKGVSDTCRVFFSKVAFTLEHVFDEKRSATSLSTLSSLIVARRARDSVSKSANVLAIGISAELAQVERELESLQYLFGEKATILKNSDADPQSVLSALPAHPIVHFSCHGARANPKEPFSAYFKLHGGVLSLHDIMQQRLPHAELAFLAACHSAVGESETPDEALSLAATLQFCGFKRVIGTLWAMHDEDGPPLAKAFYEHILLEGVEHSAVALHLAVKSLLIKNPDLSPIRWAPFVHIGI